MSESDRTADATGGDVEAARRGIEGVRRMETLRAAAFLALVAAIVIAAIAARKAALVVVPAALLPWIVLTVRRERREDAAARAAGGQALVERYRAILNRRASPDALKTYRALYIMAVALAVAAGGLLATLLNQKESSVPAIAAFAAVALLLLGVTAHDAFVWRPLLARARAAFGGPTPDDPGDAVLSRASEIAARDGILKAIVYFRDATGAGLAEATAAVKAVAPAAPARASK